MEGLGTWVLELQALGPWSRFATVSPGLCCPVAHCWVCPLLASWGFHGHAKQKSSCEDPQDPSRGSRREGAGDPGQDFDPPMGVPTELLQAGGPLCCKTEAWRCSLCGLWANHTQLIVRSLG